jgi:hypothetical protein
LSNLKWSELRNLRRAKKKGTTQKKALRKM